MVLEGPAHTLPVALLGPPDLAHVRVSPAPDHALRRGTAAHARRRRLQGDRQGGLRPHAQGMLAVPRACDSPYTDFACSLFRSSRPSRTSAASCRASAQDRARKVPMAPPSATRTSEVAHPALPTWRAQVEVLCDDDELERGKLDDRQGDGGDGAPGVNGCVCVCAYVSEEGAGTCTLDSGPCLFRDIVFLITHAHTLPSDTVRRLSSHLTLGAGMGGLGPLLPFAPSSPSPLPCPSRLQSASERKHGRLMASRPGSSTATPAR